MNIQINTFSTKYLTPKIATHEQQMQTKVVVSFKQQIINNLLQQHNKCLLFISLAKNKGFVTTSGFYFSFTSLFYSLCLLVCRYCHHCDSSHVIDPFSLLVGQGLFEFAHFPHTSILCLFLKSEVTKRQLMSHSPCISSTIVFCFFLKKN